MEQETTLYRYFSDDGGLLYVGISKHPVTRLDQHEKNYSEPWTKKISSITIERFQGRDHALLAESEAIQRENPRFNIQKPDPVKRRRKNKNYDHISMALDKRVEVVFIQIEKAGNEVPEILNSLLFCFSMSGYSMPRWFMVHDYNDWDSMERKQVEIPVNKICLELLESFKTLPLQMNRIINFLFMAYHLCDYDIIKTRDMLIDPRDYF